MSAKTGILQRLLVALKSLKSDGSADSSREIAGLRIELAERREEISILRKEYALQREQSRLQTERAESEAIESIVRQFAAPLANLSAMQVRHREQGDLNPSDIFQVAAAFDKILAERGMQPIGKVGESQPYDPVLHQMLDVTNPLPGQPVQIRFVGFRFKGKLIVKAQAGSVSKPYGL